MIDMERSRKFVAGRILANSTEPTVESRDVAARLLDVGTGIALTCLSWRRIELRQFGFGALDWYAVGENREHAFEEVGEGGEPVHPGLPETVSQH